ncbi:MAG: tetratricopeptide repeat protein [Ignavibacteria bacterium]|nr:tetratricopeptide repeat protein [Ignavibacteria bacterium]
MYEEIINKLNTILIELGKNNTTDAELMCTDVINFLDKTEIIQNGIQRNVELRAFTMLTMGKVQEDQHKHSQAIEYYNTAHDCYEILIDKEGMAKAKGNIGVIYKDLGDLEKALKYQLESLKYSKR